mmetsp:Transcript_17111/g.48933  ORF Transcript_17111/g.48933 Transcript_17111/m.48933 type:complete len:240 (+) Transcript_17111:587-1306(+)
MRRTRASSGCEAESSSNSVVFLRLSLSIVKYTLSPRTRKRRTRTRSPASSGSAPDTSDNRSIPETICPLTFTIKEYTSLLAWTCCTVPCSHSSLDAFNTAPLTFSSVVKDSLLPFKSTFASRTRISSPTSKARPGSSMALMCSSPTMLPPPPGASTFRRTPKVNVALTSPVSHVSCDTPLKSEAFAAGSALAALPFSTSGDSKSDFLCLGWFGSRMERDSLPVSLSTFTMRTTSACPSR